LQDDDDAFDSAEEEVEEVTAPRTPAADAAAPTATAKEAEVKAAADALAAAKAAAVAKEADEKIVAAAAAAAAAASAAAAAAPPKHKPGGRGKAVQIVSIDPVTNEFHLNEEELKKILLTKTCCDKPVVVISVAGPFRLGKSFLLNFFLRYIYHEGTESDWLGDDSISIAPDDAGFGWAHGSARDTTGIWMWNKPVMRKASDGRTVAVLLVDTQGTFDNQTTAEVNAMVFALNALISSFQVYNISKRIGEDILQHMHLFTKFGQMVATTKTKTSCGNDELKPFQRLLFLVRDWGSPKEHFYGSEGGEEHLADVLNVADDGNEVNRELVEVRQDIKGCFDQLGCFLLPHPGYEVAEGEGDETGEFKGQLSVIRPLFVEKLRDFVPRVLAPEALAVKRVLGEEVTCKALFEYIKVYVAEFGKGKLPQIATVFDATAKVNHQNIKDQAKKMLDEGIAELTGPNAAFRDEEELKGKLDALKEKVILFYQDTPKLDCKAVEEEIFKGLDEEVEKDYAEALLLNDNKAITKLLRTPATLAGFAFLCTLLGHFVGFVGLTAVASLLAWCTWLAFMALSFNLYCKYSGAFPEIATQIDEHCNLAYKTVEKEGMKMLLNSYQAKKTD
jgi:atlastin